MMTVSSADFALRTGSRSVNRSVAMRGVHRSTDHNAVNTQRSAANRLCYAPARTARSRLFDRETKMRVPQRSRLSQQQITFSADDLADFMCHMAEAYARSLRFADVILVLENCANAITEETARATNPRVKELLELTSEKMMAAEPFR